MVSLPFVVYEGHTESRDGASVLLVSPEQPRAPLLALGAGGCIPGHLSSDSRSLPAAGTRGEDSWGSHWAYFISFMPGHHFLLPQTRLVHYVSLRVGLSQCGSLHDR